MVFGVPDEAWGETVHAVVELQAELLLPTAPGKGGGFGGGGGGGGGGEVGGVEGSLRAHCAANIANFKIPKNFRLVGAGGLPRSPAGKVRKSELRDLAIKLASEATGLAALKSRL